MNPVHLLFKSAVVLLWTLLAITSAAPPSTDFLDTEAIAKLNSELNLREMRSFRRSPHKSSKFPLRAEETRRGSKRTGECRLGKTLHEIGDTWSPDLGEPFGTMYCIECACEPVQKKRRIVGRIQCRNIKSSCPKLDCEDAISLPGHCCKSCPENSKNSTDKTNSDALYSEDEDDKTNNREYAALLTPRSSLLIKSSTGLGSPMTSGLASGRFMFLSKSLYYSFVYNEAMPRAKFVQFLDSDGNVVEELAVTLNKYQEDTRKICGVWRKLPRVYRRLLKEEKLHVALVTEKFGQDNDRFLAGRVSKQKYVSQEMYSGLLQPSIQMESGGMAIITVSPSTGSIYTNILFNGDFDQERDIGLTVRIADTSGSSIEETVTLPKIDYSTNSVEIRSILELEQLESLARGRLFIVVYSPKNPDFKLIGFIQARATCDLFDSVLQSSEEGSGGLAWVYPMPDGSWNYNFELPPGIQPQDVKLETDGKTLEQLPFNKLEGSQIVSGMGARHYQLLYEENIFLVVTTAKITFRGRLGYRLFGNAQLSDGPLLLEGSSKNTQGLLWVGVDNDCSLNYQLTLNQPENQLLRLEILETPGLSLKGLPVKSHTILDHFQAGETEGVYNYFAQVITYAHLKAGDAMFKIVQVDDSSKLVASAMLKNVRVPTSCLPSAISENTANSLDYFLDGSAEEDESSSGRCFHDGQLREDYSQWTPLNDTCSICNCFKGQAKCEPVICPKVECQNPVLLTGECCRSCLSSKEPSFGAEKGCNVEGDRWHPAGSFWHPYMPPTGFMVCTTCTCNPDTLRVSCTKEQCPLLKDCSPDEAVFAKPLDCCKVCPPKKEIDPDTVNDDVRQYNEQSGGPNETEILNGGGCKFRDELRENGQEWNHRIEPFGYIPCVTCTCTNGSTKCGRKKCPNLNCNVKVQKHGECCPTCGAEEDLPVSRLSGKSSSSRNKKPASKHKSKTSH